jgi:hypothetical protein
MMTAAETWESPPSTGQDATWDVDGIAEEAWTDDPRLWRLRHAHRGHSACASLPVEKPRKFIGTLARSC